jgi:hypothetical protein
MGLIFLIIRSVCGHMLAGLLIGNIAPGFLQAV